MAQTYTYSLPTRVVFGPGAVDDVGKEAARLGSRAMLVTGSTFARRSGLIEKLRLAFAEAGVSLSLYDQLSPNPDVVAIDQGALAARNSNADMVVGLGGGSAMDAAKAIAVAACGTSSIWDYVGSGAATPQREIAEVLPLMQVPIVASTGSETSDTAAVLDRPNRTKGILRSPRLYAGTAIVDPTLTFSVPPTFTAIGAMNIVTQILETYLTADELSVTDRLAEGLLRSVRASLPSAMSRGEDLEARTNLSWISAFGASVTAGHRTVVAPLRSMAQPLSALFDVHYGASLAALWPSYMRYALGNRRRLPQIARFKRYALLGREIFGVHETDDEVAAEMTTYRFTSWLRDLEMPTSLRHLGVEVEDMRAPAVQAVTMLGDGTRLAGGLTVEDVENIYEGALNPRG